MRTHLNLCLGLIVAAAAWAQPPVAPTNEPTESNRGDNVSNYNILQSFELGYRWNTNGGDDGMYRSTVNYTNGIRLLSSSLNIQSREGHGGLFDQLQLNTQGLGNDPYESAILRIEKNRLYRYDLTWRSDAYYNPGLTVSFGEHFMDTVRHLQDQDLTLFPQSWIRFFLGYSRDTQSGPALSTIQLFDGIRGDEFPLFTNVNRQQNEYRLGGEVRVLGFRLNVLHGWEDFKDDTQRTVTVPEPGNNPNDLSQLNSFQGVEPYHGTSPYWRVGLFREGKKYWAMNGRFSYVAGARGFVLNEASTGLGAVGANTFRQVLTFGNADRPTATGNLTFSLFPTSNITFTNQTSVYNIRMLGNSYFEQYTNGSATLPVYNFNYLGILTIANSSDVQIRLRRWFTVHGGFTYDDRRIHSFEATKQNSPPGTPVGVTQTNLLHAGTLGFRIKPMKPLTITLDGDLGRTDHPIFPISENNYTALRARVEYKLKSFRAAAFARSDYNVNSASLDDYASKSRQYGIDATWTGTDWFSIDAGYSRMHLNTLGGINYFVAGLGEVTTDQSYYVSNIHTGTVMARFSVRKRADVSVGYSHVQDVGDGRATAQGSGLYTAQPAFQAAQTFPLRFLSPQARVSFRITQKIRWNAGYQYYGYREDFLTAQNYRAHTGYSSVSWSF
jgi:hypothetical protein